MAENRTRPVSRVKPATVFSAVAVGAVTASLGVSGAPAFAVDYPSWGEIEQAKQNEQTKQAEIARLGELLAGLQATADAAVRDSQIAAEAYRQTVIERDEAVEREASLGKQADEAEAVAEISKMRAGLIAAHLAKAGGNDLTTSLVFSGDSAGLLKQLGMASKLGEQSTSVYEQALADRNAADSLREQADAAAKERKKLADDAKSQYDDAQSKADAATAAVAEQERRSSELYAQLARLKDTTAELERERVEGIAREEAEEALRPDPPATGGGNTGGGNTGGGNTGGGNTGGGNTGGGGTTPTPTTPPKPTTPKPPNQGAVESAIWYASQQLGEPYRLGGAGPDVWDCSGLTKMAYGYAGIYVGTHSATNQYYTLAGQGKAVSLGSIQRGDLLFWGSGGDYYHVAIYLGGGRILEAPREGVPVREYFIWGSPSAAARPTG
ncbi:NlpC/P60 family protein [Agromyces soli]|uniref:NlpC/P60 family protein n=1 Tax=Agromyces soli TaxID=659012 RepID=A0ABY4AXB0_9MICO|nr:C40 family peptidase [Agromyces soli]UOE27820.1 NlpC/P60 family protein [Agromyces soli]